jgi:hypothetical protein
MSQRAPDLDGFFGQTSGAKENGHEIWDTECKKSLKAGSLKTVGEEMSKYKLDLALVQEVRWTRGRIEPAGEYRCLYGKGNENLVGGYY